MLIQRLYQNSTPSWIRTNAVTILSRVPLPLGYKGLAFHHGFEPRFSPPKGDVLPLDEWKMAEVTGFEPVDLSIYDLANRCIRPLCHTSLERVTRIELALSAWKAETLPLCNTRTAGDIGLEPMT